MLAILSDVKNFTIGSVAGGMNGAGRWGKRALGWGGEAYTHPDHGGQFRHINMGGLFYPAAAAGLLTLNPAVFLTLWLGGTVVAAMAGGVIGTLIGGYREVREGREDRRAWEDALDGKQQDSTPEKADERALKRAMAEQKAIEKEQRALEKEEAQRTKNIEKWTKKFQKEADKDAFTKLETERREASKTLENKGIRS